MKTKTKKIAPEYRMRIDGHVAEAKCRVKGCKGPLVRVLGYLFYCDVCTQDHYWDEVSESFKILEKKY